MYPFFGEADRLGANPFTDDGGAHSLLYLIAAGDTSKHIAVSHLPQSQRDPRFALLTLGYHFATRLMPARPIRSASGGISGELMACFTAVA
jgi:hypothetical protein